MITLKLVFSIPQGTSSWRAIFLVLSAVLIFGDIWQMALAYSGAAWRANKTYSFKHNCQTAGVHENKTMRRPI